MAAETIDVQPLNVDHPQNGVAGPRLVLVVGERGRGKTTTTKYMVSQRAEARDGITIVMAGSRQVESAWQECCPKLFVVEMSINYLEKLFRRQEARIAEYAARGLPLPAKYHITIILDDCGDRTFLGSRVIKFLARSGRQLYVSAWIMLQSLSQCPPVVRSQADTMVLLATSSLKNIRLIHSEYVSTIPLRTLRAVVSAITEDHGALVIKTGRSRISDMLFYVRAPYPADPASIIMGCAAQWEFSRRHYLNLTHLQQARREMHNPSAPQPLDDDDDDDSGIHLELANNTSIFREHMELLDNRRVYSDKHGRVVVRRVIQSTPTKTKVD
jgi:hypothetical protein